MTEPASQHTELTERLEQALAGSPLSLAPHDPEEMLDNDIGLHDSRFDTPLAIDADRLETLLHERSIADVATGLENLSAAYAISDAVEAGNPYDGGQTVSIGDQGFFEKAFDQGIMTFAAEGDQMRVDVPIADVANVPPPYSPERMGSRAVGIMENELDRLTGTTFVERVEMTTPVGHQLANDTSVGSDSPFATGSPFDTGDPFASASADSAAETSAGAEPIPAPEVQPVHEPGL